MRLRLLLVGATVIAGLVGIVPAASAQGVTIDRGGVYVQPPSDRNYNDRGYGDRGYGDRNVSDVTPREARRIARRAGIVEVDTLSRRGRVWIVRGVDRRGNDIRVTISVRSGEVLDVSRR